MMDNPVKNAANAFMIIWQHLPDPIRALFVVSLLLALLWGLYCLLSR